MDLQEINQLLDVLLKNTEKKQFIKNMISIAKFLKIDMMKGSTFSEVMKSFLDSTKNDLQVRYYDIFHIMIKLDIQKYFPIKSIADCLSTKLDADNFFEYQVAYDDDSYLTIDEAEKLAALLDVNKTIVPKKIDNIDHDATKYTPLAGGEWKYVPASLFKKNTSLWSHKKNGLVRQKYCFNQIVHLSKIIKDEYWGINREYLYAYLDYTFRYLARQGLVMAFWINCNIQLEDNIDHQTNTNQETIEDYDDDFIIDQEKCDDTSIDNNDEPNYKNANWKPPIIDPNTKKAAIILVWNTGLTNRLGDAIYSIMIPYYSDDGYNANCTWYLKWFHVAAEFAMKKKFISTLSNQFYKLVLNVNKPNTDNHGIDNMSDLDFPLLISPNLPKKATYLSGNIPVACIQFDQDINFDLDIDTDILDDAKLNKMLPESLLPLLQNKTSFILKIKSSLKQSVLHAQRDPRIAVPYYNIHNNNPDIFSLNLLLPAKLNENSEKYEFVFVVNLVKYLKNDSNIDYVYRIRNLLNLSTAYLCARIVSYPPYWSYDDFPNNKVPRDVIDYRNTVKNINTFSSNVQSIDPKLPSVKHDKDDYDINARNNRNSERSTVGRSNHNINNDRNNRNSERSTVGHSYHNVRNNRNSEKSIVTQLNNNVICNDPYIEYKKIINNLLDQNHMQHFNNDYYEYCTSEYDFMYIIASLSHSWKQIKCTNKHNGKNCELACKNYHSTEEYNLWTQIHKNYIQSQSYQYQEYHYFNQYN
jgi:hypothetical protein